MQGILSCLHWQQAVRRLGVALMSGGESAGAASLAEATQELAAGDGTLATSAKRAQEASQCLSKPQSAGKLDPAGARCALTGLPHTACPDIPLVELHGRPAWVHQLANPLMVSSVRSTSRQTGQALNLRVLSLGRSEREQYDLGLMTTTHFMHMSSCLRMYCETPCFALRPERFCLVIRAAVEC